MARPAISKALQRLGSHCLVTRPPLQAAGARPRVSGGFWKEEEQSCGWSNTGSSLPFGALPPVPLPIKLLKNISPSDKQKRGPLLQRTLFTLQDSKGKTPLWSFQTSSGFTCALRIKWNQNSIFPLHTSFDKCLRQIFALWRMGLCTLTNTKNPQVYTKV